MAPPFRRSIWGQIFILALSGKNGGPASRWVPTQPDPPREGGSARTHPDKKWHVNNRSDLLLEGHRVCVYVYCKDIYVCIARLAGRIAKPSGKPQKMFYLQATCTVGLNRERGRGSLNLSGIKKKSHTDAGRRKPRKKAHTIFKKANTQQKQQFQCIKSQSAQKECVKNGGLHTKKNNWNAHNVLHKKTQNY